MKIKKIIIAFIIMLTYSSSSFALDETINTGNPVLDGILSSYESGLKNDSKRKTLYSKFINQKVSLKKKALSDDLKDDIIDNQAKTVKKISLKNDISSIKDNQKVLSRLVSSMKKQNTNYRLFIKTSLNETDLKDLLSFFDQVNVTLASSSDGYSIFELSFPNNWRLAKKLFTNLDSWELPANLTDNIEIVKPFAVTSLVSTGTYLSWEYLPNMWWQNKIWATNYQYWLSLKTKIKIGEIDTWVDYNNSDLWANIDYVNGYNFISGTTNVLDDHWHGTHVAWIIWWLVNWKWVFWVNSNASIVPLKVIDASWYGSSYAIVDAINYAANKWIKVLNMSIWWTGTPSNDIICNAISSAKLKWTISVVAAGNENTDVSTKVPAGCSDAITVWAVDSNLNKASFSNYWSKVDVAAPGVYILSTYLNNNYVYMDGTSMATPYIAWLVSAILANNPNLTKDDILTILKNTTNTDSVNSGVNIWRFANMNKIMTSLWVQDDSLIWTWDSSDTSSWSTSSGTISPDPTPAPVNNPPILNLSSTKISTNNYKITATATDSDWTIVNYSFYNWQTLLYSWTLNYINIAITQNTTVNVSVKDNSWAVTTKSISLTYEQPVANKLPVIKYSYTYPNKRTIKLTLNMSDSDGKIVRTDININWALYYVNSNSSSVTVYFTMTKWYTYNLKVKTKDNLWWISESSFSVK